MHHIPLLQDDSLIDLLELFCHFEVEVADLVKFHLGLLLLGGPLDLLHLEIVCLLPQVLKLDGVARLGNGELLLQGLDGGLELGEGAVVLGLSELRVLVNDVNDLFVGKLELILLDLVLHEAQFLVRTFDVEGGILIIFVLHCPKFL